MKFIDLHTHSNASDGSLTPDALIQRAADVGLSAIALTDHDTTEGLAAAKAAADDLGIEFIPGIELSAFYEDREVHIVGLYIQSESAEFQNMIYDVSHAREIRNKKMIQKMAEAGVDISEEKMATAEGTGILTRANFACYLKNLGIVKTNQEAFDKYLDRGKPFYIPRNQLTPENAIKAIQIAGGVPILAHPLLYKFSESELDRCVRYLKELGILGLEAYYSRNHGTDTIRMKKLADKYDLVYSGGSDFHGAYKPDIELGSGTGNLVVPYELLGPIKQSF